MKKKTLKYLLSTLVVLLLSSLFALPTFAENTNQYVYDPTYTLTDDEYYELNNKAYEISQQYECAVHFVITDDPTLNENNIQSYSEDLYLHSDSLGYGVDKDGFMLVVNVETRCYWLLAYGKFGNYALTDYGKEWLSERFVDNFSTNDWYGGMHDYLLGSEEALKQALNGKPIDIYEDVNTEDNQGLMNIIISAFAGIISSFFTVNGFKKEMQTAVKATQAHNYLDSKHANIIFRMDRFTHKTETRTKIETNNEGKGTTVNSKGFSGKGGKF